MPFCTNCGAEVAANTRFCANCGAALAADNATTEAPKYEYKNTSNAEPWERPPVYTAQPVQDDDTQRNKFLCILCYFGLLLLIPLLTQPNSRYCKFHSNQGLVLMLLEIAVGIVAIIPILGWIASAVGGIFCFVCWIIGIVNTANGRMKPLPIIGKINILG